MRAILFAWAAYLAPFALGLPIALVDKLEAISHAAHPPAPIAATRPEHALPKIILDAKGSEILLDNRPITPSGSEEPSAALASPHPVSTTYLLSLTQPWQKNRYHQKAAQQDQVEVNGVMMQAGRFYRPCKSSYRHTEQSDVLVIGMVLTFVLVVVVVETWGALCKRFVARARSLTPWILTAWNSFKRTFLGHGAIRLEEEDVGVVSAKTLFAEVESKEETTASSEKSTI